MNPSIAEGSLARWSVPRIPLAIEYLVPVMQEIRAAVCGGSTQGGVLFGTRADASVRIVAWRPADALGDGRDLLRLGLAAKHDPKLEALQPLGWFVSHALGGITLNAPDLEIYDGYFSEPWQVTLVLVPSPNGAAQAGFFAREADGSLLSESSYREFAVQPPEPTEWLRLVPWAIAAVLAIILAFVLARPRRAEFVNPGISLRIQNTGPLFRIAWDPNAIPIRAAKRADIDIQDGDPPAHFSIGATQLREGNVVWQPKTSDVRVRMTVHGDGGAVTREFARLVVKTTPAPAPSRPNPLEAEVKRLNQELHQERVITDRLKQSVKILENTIAVDKAREKQ